MPYRLGMPVHPKSAAAGGVAGIALAVTLLTGGCVGPTEVVPTLTATEAAPIFASDEEALAAAEEAYAAYLAMSDLIAQEGGRDPERIAPFVTEQQLVVELEGFASLAANGARLDGASRLGSVELQDVAGDMTTVAAYVCIDYSAATYLRGDGSSIKTNREFESVLVLARFSKGEVAPALILAAVEPWTQTEPCS